MPSNNQMRGSAVMDAERFLSSECAINTKDCDTILLKINDHFFSMSYAEFIGHLYAMSENARDFKEKFRQQPELKN